MEEEIEMEGVREYIDGRKPLLVIHNSRLCIEAINERGHASTIVDLEDLMAWVKNTMASKLVKRVK